MKKPKKSKKPKEKRFRLHLTFTVSEMRKVRQEVADRKLQRKKLLVDELLYTIAWTFHQELTKLGMPD